jgi:hypothetical protein
MAEETRVTLEELVVSTLAMSDALTKLLIAKGVITVAKMGSPRRDFRFATRLTENPDIGVSAYRSEC